jgi:FkbM family methyltransferase
MIYGSYGEKSGQFAGHHPIFNEFKPFNGKVSTDYEVDYIGALTHKDVLPQFEPRTNEMVTSSTPPVDEEYFEWIDILSSVKDAKDNYCMLELGAGYGRWGVRAALAARQKNISQITIGFAEAEPAHLIHLRQRLQYNNIKETEYRIHECAVSDERGRTYFYVGMPDRLTDDITRTWFGQAIVHSDEEKDSSNDNVLYFGHPVIKLKSGWQVIEVEKMHIREILEMYGSIDLIDMDVQGQEAVIIDSSIKLFNEQVKRLHIGTHSEKIEMTLRRTLGKNGWSCLQDYSLNRTNDTPFGPVSFTDGVQSWVNPRFKVPVSPA